MDMWLLKSAQVISGNLKGPPPRVDSPIQRRMSEKRSVSEVKRRAGWRVGVGDQERDWSRKLRPGAN